MAGGRRVARPRRNSASSLSGRSARSSSGGDRTVGSELPSLGLESMLQSQRKIERRKFLRKREGPISRAGLDSDRRESRVIRALEQGNADDISTALTGLQSRDTADGSVDGAGTAGPGTDVDLTEQFGEAPTAAVSEDGDGGPFGDGDDVHGDRLSSTPAARSRPRPPTTIRRVGSASVPRATRASDAKEAGGSHGRHGIGSARSPLHARLGSSGRDRAGAGTAGAADRTSGRSLFMRTQATPLRRIGSRLAARTADVVGGRSRLEAFASAVEGAEVSTGSAGQEAAAEAARAPAVTPFQHYLGGVGERIGMSEQGRRAYARPHLGGAGAAPNWHKRKRSRSDKSDGSGPANAGEQGNTPGVTAISRPGTTPGGSLHLVSPRMASRHRPGTSQPRMTPIRLDLSKVARPRASSDASSRGGNPGNKSGRKAPSDSARPGSDTTAPNGKT